MLVDLLPKTRELIDRSDSSAELADFSKWLAEQHYTPLIIHSHVYRLEHIFGPRRGAIFQTVVTAKRLEAVFGKESSPLGRRKAFRATQRVYQRFLLGCDRLHVIEPDDRFAALRQDYARYLVEILGFSLSTRQHHAQEVADFLVRGVRPRQQLRSLSRVDIERFISIRSQETARQSLQHTVGVLRSFLRFIFHAGLIPSPLDSLDTVLTHRGELPPRALPWATVQRLLASIDPCSTAGWRDRCILHLLAHYGLRPSEVSDLTVDSIDWDAEVLHVHQRKTRSDLLLPLATPTLRLLRDYFRHCRDQQGTTHTGLFLRARCPDGAISHYAVCDIFDKRSREAGIEPGSCSVYCLRHTFAMRLLGRGVGVKAIGDILGHRSLESTCAYLRLDIGMLRDVALPIPRSGSRRGVNHA